jgi:hypothetical protein
MGGEIDCFPPKTGNRYGLMTSVVADTSCVSKVALFHKLEIWSLNTEAKHQMVATDLFSPLWRSGKAGEGVRDTH